LFGLNAVAFGRHVLVAVFDDAEELPSVRSLGLAGLVKSGIVSFLLAATSPLLSPSLPWHIAQSTFHHFRAWERDSLVDLKVLTCLEASAEISA